MANRSNKNKSSGEQSQSGMIHMKNNRPLHNVKSLPLEILNWIENNSNDVITIWNQSGKLLFVSDSVEQLLGFKANAITNKSWNTFLTVEDAHYISKKFTNEINVKQMFNIPLFNHNDLPVWCGITAVKLVAHHEPYYVAILKDITDKKEAEELMIRSEKMSIAGQLAAGIAHEIRNPLTSLKGFLQLLQAGVEQKDVYYKIMIDEIIKMEQITSELLYISKPLTDFKQDESLRTMIQDVIELLNTQAKLKDITLTHQQENNIFLHCDRSQIKQVLINIVKNAIEAMDSTGEIFIIVQQEAYKTTVEIVDEGPGIEEGILHKLGEPFFTTKQNGTGLGLMISKQILDRHHATLDIFKNDDKGSTFRITFYHES